MQNADPCDNCGGYRHFAKDCTSMKVRGGLCFKCGMGGYTVNTCTNMNNPVRCSNCNGVGHDSYGCPSKFVPDQCSRCKSTDHMVRECPDRKEEDGDYSAWEGHDHCATCGEKGHFPSECTVGVFKYK